MEDSLVKALRIIADVMVPGDGYRWPPASVALTDPACILTEIAAQHRGWSATLVCEIANSAPESRARILQRIEAEEPERFAAFVGAVFRAYYTTPSVTAIVAEIANAGPREVDPHFDADLVAQVLMTGAGRRRL